MKIDAGTPKRAETRDMIFSDLHNGDLFQTEEGMLFVRTESIITDWDEYNAVNVADGEVVYFDDSTKVAKYVEYIKLVPEAFVREVPID